MKKYIQIYTGGVFGRNVTSEEIEEKLSLFQEKKPDGIIVGWSLEVPVYKYLREYTAKNHIEYYLWFQVFSEFKNLKDFSFLKDIDGNQINSLLFDGDEEFSFYCPSHFKTISYLKEIYEEYFSEIGFDGVFLDRIRFPSPAFDEKALFSCCCSECMKKFYRFGIQEEDIKLIQYYVKESKTADSILSIEKYDNGKYLFQKKQIEKYLYARAELITESVKELSDYFREKGLKVGLDLFAPFLAIFVGQDYEQLSECADFIKPMLYRYTDTPAGINYEMRGAVKSFSEKNTEKIKMQSFKNILKLDENNISDFMRKEANAARKLSKCEVMAGIEIHTIPELEKIKPEQIQEGIQKLEQADVQGRVASWNLLAAERDNIIAFMKGGE